MYSRTERGHTPIELRELFTVAELRPLEALQRTVWGIDDLEIVPATIMSAATHAGGLVVGAFLGQELVGFAYGFVATPHGRGMAGTGLHSHMAAVSPEHRSKGVGRSLKRFQAEWCRRRGLRWISWTFDPLLAKNARFNLSVLGARAYDYLVDVYGPMPGALGGGIASDRLLAVWVLDDEYTASAQIGAATTRTRPAAKADDRDDGLWLLRCGPGNEPQENSLDVASEGQPVRIATPTEGLALFEDASKAMAWREAHRRTLGRQLDAGYAVTGFEGGGFVLCHDATRNSQLKQAEPQRL